MKLSIFLSDRTKGTLLALCGVLILSVDPLLLRFVSNLPNFTVIVYKYTISVIVLLLVIISQEGSHFGKAFRDVGWLGVIAGFMLGANNVFFTLAIQWGVVANVLVIVASNSIFSALFSYFLFKEIIALRTAITCLVRILYF